MGGCVNKSNKKGESKDFTVDPSNFVKVRKENIRDFYEIRDKIGDGSFGSVYLAKDKKKHKKRAVKSILINGPQGGDLKSILREVKILQGMDHPNIIKVYEVFQDSSFLHIVTEYCRGGELFDKIVKNGYISENQAAKYTLEILSAVKYIHSRNMVHRDIKPENLLFESNEEDSHLKLIDFGTCKHYKGTIRLQERIGSIYYMAPEVVSSNYDNKCDVWSTGVILYVMLSGMPPFNGKSESEIMLSIISKQPLFEGDVWRSVSPEAIDLIRSMLQKNAASRPTAEEAFKNPWLQSRGNNSVPDKVLAQYSLQNLRAFSTSSKLQRATLAFIVSQVMSSDEIALLKDTFMALDKNGDGFLSADELKEAAATFNGDFDVNIEEILKKVDEDGNGCINYNEFLTAAVDWENELSKKRLHQAFELFDKDGSGKISANELLDALGGNKNQTNLFIEMIKEADTNGDGEIDLEEFCNFMKNLKKNEIPENRA